MKVVTPTFDLPLYNITTALLLPNENPLITSWHNYKRNEFKNNKTNGLFKNICCVPAIFYYWKFDNISINNTRPIIYYTSTDNNNNNNFEHFFICSFKIFNFVLQRVCVWQQQNCNYSNNSRSIFPGVTRRYFRNSINIAKIKNIKFVYSKII